MDYLYENLGDERFQEFCSCIISKEFPNAQAYPVGQPDGGRDTLVYDMGKTKKEFIVFQVKFVRNNLERNLHKWLVETIKGEIEKIGTLIPEGAKAYYLLTNVKSTGHKGIGSKDILNKILEENIKIPAVCWWREDINMLFEKDILFKWSFPEILNGQDILNSILFQNINESKERRGNVIKAYLADQYDMDNEVKFRQIDLQNGLYDLFIDVPSRLKSIDCKKKDVNRIRHIIGNIQKRTPIISENWFLEEDKKIGAAAFLLNSQVQTGINRILLEGGPGQGKSTISQYVSQVHRSRLLNKECDFCLIPEDIIHTAVRLPFKIDLRHVASWVEKSNPYPGVLSEETFSHIWNKSLESFLIGHIFFHSKIEEFTASDLIAICKVSSVLFVFDGFDEIANIKVREEVVDFINKGINRISENSKDIQVLITSRPAAFSDLIGFGKDIYPHFELTDITQDNIDNYVEKWIKCSKLKGREAIDIRRLVKDKLELPHLRDLTKSPMQLAIFVTLLRTDGESLPNKRTALYDSYIRLFFNRESEKNIIIRDKRDLIIQIHEYLAWVMHSEAELNKNSGVIKIEELKTKLNLYLEKEGHGLEITDQLFQVIKERVCALVSRVQGTFEFEVQPLREYFCAKYLYKTKPYSPVGAEKRGTLPDRFDAISRNFYWQNVMRFFSGCFDKGELSMLVQKLRELTNDNLLKYTDYPREITAQLLSDYVFKQYPLLLKDVVGIIINSINIGNIVSRDEQSSGNGQIVIPPDSGRAELNDECFVQLLTFPNTGYAIELIGLIKNNPDRTVERWEKPLEEIKGEQISIWFEYAYRLQIIHLLDENVLLEIVSEDEYKYTEERIKILIKGNRADVIDKNAKLKDIALSVVLKSEIGIFIRNRKMSGLGFLALVFNPYVLLDVIKADVLHIVFKELLSFYTRLDSGRGDLSFEINDDIDKKIFEFQSGIKSVLEIEIDTMKKKIEPWDIMVENGRKIFGDCWSLYIVAAIAVAVKGEKETYGDYSNLGDREISLCKRAHSARTKSGNIKYWEGQLDDENELMFKLLMFFTWATPMTIMTLYEPVTSLITTLNRNEYMLLARGIGEICKERVFSKVQMFYIFNEIQNKNLNDLFKYLVSCRFEIPKRDEFVYNNVESRGWLLGETNSKKLEYLIEKYLNDVSNHELLMEIKQLNSELKTFDNRHYLRFDNKDIKQLPLEIAKEIMTQSRNFPKVLGVLAEKTCRQYANENVRPVYKISQNENWFD